jgi:hypothetical protein
MFEHAHCLKCRCSVARTMHAIESQSSFLVKIQENCGVSTSFLVCVLKKENARCFVPVILDWQILWLILRCAQFIGNCAQRSLTALCCQGNSLLQCQVWVLVALCKFILHSTLNMEATYFSETLVTTVWRYRNHIPHFHGRMVSSVHV